MQALTPNTHISTSIKWRGPNGLMEMPSLRYCSVQYRNDK